MAMDTPQTRYDAKNIIHINMKLNKKTDADVLAKLDAVDNKQGYIKKLIRADLAREARREQRRKAKEN